MGAFVTNFRLMLFFSQDALSFLHSDNFAEQHSALDVVRRASLHHPAVINGHGTELLSGINACVTSLRSALARNALLALDDMSECATASLSNVDLSAYFPSRQLVLPIDADYVATDKLYLRINVFDDRSDCCGNVVGAHHIG